MNLNGIEPLFYAYQAYTLPLSYRFLLKIIGALTSKNFSFKARSWEFKFLKSLDIFDIFGLDLRVDYRFNSIFRIVILKNFKETKDFLSSYISDISRYFFDSLIFQRIKYPLIKIFNNFIIVNWNIIFLYLKLKLGNNFFNNLNFFTLLGNFKDLKALYSLKKFINRLGFNLYFQNFFFDNLNLDFNFFFTNFLKYINNDKFFFCFFGLNLRFDFPFLFKILKKFANLKTKFFKIYNFLNNFIFFKNNLIDNYGSNLYNFFKFFFGKINFFKILSLKFFNFIFIFGINFFQGLNFNYFKIFRYFLYRFRYFYNNIKDFFWINNSLDLVINLPFISTFNQSDLGFLDNFYGKLGYINNINNLKDLKKKNILLILDGNDFNFFNFFDLIIYQGSHMDFLFYKADIILPIETIFENNFFFLNFFGKLKISESIIGLNESLILSTDIKILNIFLFYYFNYIFSKFGLKLKYNFNIQFFDFFFFKFLFLNVLGLPNLYNFNWWSNHKRNGFFVLNFFQIFNNLIFNSFFFFRIQENIFNNYLIINKYFLNFIYNIYKINNYTRFSKNLIIASLKNRNFNFK